MALPRLWAPMLAAVAFGAFAIFLPALSLAQSSEIEQLRSVVDGLQQQLQKALQRIDQLEKERTATSDKVNELEQEKTTTSGRIGQVEKSVQAVQSAPSALNPAIGMVLDANVSQRSKAGGNFNFRSAEIGLALSLIHI